MFTKLNFNFSLKIDDEELDLNTKLDDIDRLVRSKYMCGLFKKKFDMKTTVLKEHGFLNFYLQDEKKEEKEILDKNTDTYKDHKMFNAIFYNKVKSMFSENRKIFKFFFNKKNLKIQKKINKFFINFLNKDSKTILNYFEYKLD